ncbi:penicillin acylase family protein [Phaeobacter piscinae]|uniref:penicillin acylase family protein n=1 Tax=Phaeobacter piscinae TaxID=1580596 RepID=UPI0039F6A094
MPIAPRGLAGASNAWAAAPSRSAAGGTLMANDSPSGADRPGVWYLARLELGTGGVIGATIPGIPAVISGRSDLLGWGVTSSYMDDQDLFIEQLNPDNAEEYKTADGYKRFTSRPSIINIKDETPVTLTLRWTDNGPVLPGPCLISRQSRRRVTLSALAGRASALDTSISAALELMRANSVAQAIEISEGYIAPSQNLTLADKTTVALKTVGAIPQRDARHQSQGRMPSQGWRSENQWQGRAPYAANPEFVSPLEASSETPTTSSWTARFPITSLTLGAIPSASIAGRS